MQTAYTFELKKHRGQIITIIEYKQNVQTYPPPRIQPM